jgi:DNA repair exonuclease SbcCD ATPase subunit
MWKIIGFEAENLFSYKKVKVDVLQQQTTLVYGINNTDSGVKSNGSGKSSLLDIICLSIIGETLRKIKKRSIVTRGVKEGSSSITLRNDMLDSTLEIKSTYSVSSSNKVQLWIDGVMRKDLADLKSDFTYDEIIRLIGVSRDDLINYYFISKDKYQSFFKSNDSTKKDVINRFSNASIIDPLDDIIKADADRISGEINTLNISLSSIDSKIQIYNEQKQEVVEENSDENKEQLIADLNDDIKTKEDEIKRIKDLIALNEVVIKDDLKIKEFNKEILKYDNLVRENEEKLVKLNKTIESKSLEYTKLSQVRDSSEKAIEEKIRLQKIKEKEIEDDITETKNFITDINNHLAGTIECPKCRHKFILADKEYDLEAAEKALPQAQELLNDHETDLQNSKKKILNLRLDITKIETTFQNDTKQLTEERNKLGKEKSTLENLKSSNETELTSCRNKLKAEQTKIENLKSDNISNKEKIEKAKNQIISIKDEIKEIKEKDNKVKLKEIQTKIDNQQKERKVIESQQQVKQEELTETNFWRLNFKKFKSYLANTSISAIEDQTNHFLFKMKTDLSIKIDGFRELSNGKLKEEISIAVSTDGVDENDFNEFSGGEKSKCDLACILAMQQLINQCSENGGLDFCFIDEILESNDSEAMQYIITSLFNLNRTIWIITHIDPDKFFDCNKIIIEKNQKISEIK